MKKIYILFTTLLFISLCQLALAAEPETGSLVENESSIHLGNGTKIKSKLLTENLPEFKTTIKASYPQIMGDNLTPEENQFNKLMLAMTTQEITQFKKYVNADLVHMKTLPLEVQNNSLYIDYDIDVIHPNNNTIVMVRTSIEGMQAGRAHPYHRYHVFNFNLNSGKVLGLADLFKPKTNYLKLISDYSRKELLAKSNDNAITDMINKGTKLDPSNFKNWNIQNDTLLITFDEYQVGPYVNGPQEVEIPYSALKNIIAKDSVIHSCIENPGSCG